jgi:hypothetical protein
MDIHSGADYPANTLSNFAPHAFCFDGETAASMEGLLQSLKYKDDHEAQRVRWLTGVKAKNAGLAALQWQSSQTLWWKGRPMQRSSLEYQTFLDGAFHALYTQNAQAAAALRESKSAPLTHDVGHDDPTRTVLTSDEFCSRLLRLRKDLRLARPWQFPFLYLRRLLRRRVR